MALNIPLPNPQSLTGDVADVYNELTNRALNKRKQELFNKYYGPEKESEINLRSAQTNKLNVMTPLEAKKQELENQYIPTKYENQTRNSYTNQGRLQNSVNNTYKDWVKSPEGQKIISGPNGKGFAQAVYNSMFNAAMQASQGNAINSNPQLQNPMDDSSNNINNIPREFSQQNQMGNQNQGKVNFSFNQPQGNQEQIIKDIQDAAEDKYFRQNYPAEIQKRLYAGDRFKSAIPQVLNNFKEASFYFSPSGQKQLAVDEEKAFLTHKTPRKLQAYRKFEQGIEQLKVQGAFLEGVPADQISRSSYAKIFDNPRFFNNPVDARNLLNNAIRLGLLSHEANKTRPNQLLKSRSQDIEIEKLMSESEKGADTGEEEQTKMVTIRNKKTGRSKKVTLEEAKRLGAI